MVKMTLAQALEEIRQGCTILPLKETTQGREGEPFSFGKLAL